MVIVIFSALTFIAIIFGGILSVKFKDNVQLILGFTAGILFGLVTLEILPEIFELAEDIQYKPIYPMVALVVGFLIFHILEKTALVHHAQEENYRTHHHPAVGLFSVIALIFHSFLDGVGIGVGFQISSALGIAVAIAVIGHAFSDGLNTGSIMLLNKNSVKKTYSMILLNAIAPVLGVITTQFLDIPEGFLLIYLGAFAGFLLYIALEDILPEAHSKGSSRKTIALTILGIVFIYLVTMFE